MHCDDVEAGVELVVEHARNRRDELAERAAEFQSFCKWMESNGSDPDDIAERRAALQKKRENERVVKEAAKVAAAAAAAARELERASQDLNYRILHRRPGWTPGEVRHQVQREKYEAAMAAKAVAGAVFE